LSNPRLKGTHREQHRASPSRPTFTSRSPTGRPAAPARRFLRNETAIPSRSPSRPGPLRRSPIAINGPPDLADNMPGYRILVRGAQRPPQPSAWARLSASPAVGHPSHCALTPAGMPPPRGPAPRTAPRRIPCSIQTPLTRRSPPHPPPPPIVPTASGGVAPVPTSWHLHSTQPLAMHLSGAWVVPTPVDFFRPS